MTTPRHKRRSQIPVPELSDYLLDEEGAVWRKGGHRNGRDRRLALMSFTKAMQCLGQRVGITLIPFPICPGIWKMRSAGTIEGSPYLGGNSLADFFRKHAFGPDRVHPKWWPSWSQPASEVAASIAGEQAPIWTVLTHLKHDSDPWRNLMQSVDAPEIQTISHQSSPVIVLGQLARVEIFRESPL